MNHTLVAGFRETGGGVRAEELLKKLKLSSEQVLLQVLASVAEVVPALQHGALYSAEQLCGPELWSQFKTVGARRSAGMCLAYLVDRRALPLKLHVTPSGKGPRRYKLSLHWQQGASFVP